MAPQDDDDTTTSGDATVVDDTATTVDATATAADDTATADDDGDDTGTTAPAAAKGKADPRDAELAAVKQEAARRRVRLKELEAEVAKLREANATEQERAIMAARTEGAAESVAKYRPAVVRANARAALSAAGCTDGKVQGTLMRLIDAGTVELDDDGEIVAGLDDQIATLREQFPEKFAAGKPAVPPARQVAAANKPAPAVPKTVEEQLVARLTGRSGG
jgi:hypothetical protein